MSGPTDDAGLFRLSAVGLVDALGFKGIEARIDPGAVVAAMRAVRKAMAETAVWMNKDNWQHAPTLGGRPKVTCSWFSDTICIVAQPPEETVFPSNSSDDRVRAALVDIMVMCVGYLLREAAITSPPFAFRGVISVGKMVVADENIYIGPAIAEAAGLYEQAEGAFVWLSPAAFALKFPVVMNHRGQIEYKVPLKGGQSISTTVVNPFIDMLARSYEGDKVRVGIERAMEGDRIDIVIKRQNTVDFMNHVAQTEPVSVRREHEFPP